MRFTIVLLLILSSTSLIGCGAYKTEMSVDVEPDETAFMIQLEGDTKAGQKKFESVEFLEEMKISKKRIILPQRKLSTGYLWNSYKYIPTATVIKVSRRPEQREWTDDTSTGTDASEQKLQVESLDSIGIAIGATIQARVEEDDTAKFVYYFNGRQLSQIIDSNVRGYAQMQLAQRFGTRKLELCKVDKGQIFKESELELQTYFKKMGITVDYFGSSEGLTFENPRIQAAIDAQVESEAKIIEEANKKLAKDKVREDEIAASVATAQAELERETVLLEAATIRANRLKIEKAAEANAALELLNQKDALEFELHLLVSRLAAEAKVEAAKSLKDIRILPAGSGLLLGLDNK